MNPDVFKHNLIKSIVFIAVLILGQVVTYKMRILNVAPNLIFVLVLASSLVEDKNSNIAYALIFGMLYDFFNGKIFGIYTIIFVLISFVVSEIYHKYFENMTPVQTLLMVLGSLVYSLLIAIFFVLRDVKFIYLFTKVSIIEFVYNSLLGMITIMIYKRAIVVKRSAWRIR